MVKYSDEEIIEAYKVLGTQTSVSKSFNVAQSYVHKVLKRNGIMADGKQRCVPYNQKVTDEEIIEACKTLSSGEIQKKFGIRQCTLYERCQKLGAKPVKKKQKQERNPGLDKCIRRQQLFKGVWHYWEPHAKKFAEHKDVTYLESKGTTARIKCEVCGHIYEVGTKKDSDWKCKKCGDRQQELYNSRAGLITALKHLKECPECGVLFYASSTRKMFCSRKCKAKRFVKSHPKSQSYRGRCRRYGTYYDPEVKREDVIKRDKGVCQICGKLCDPSDKSWGSSGPNYPTVDHIRPLAKGGTHTWDNVQCACGMCNSEKRDLLYG